MVTSSGTIKFATPTEIRKFADSSITADQAVSQLRKDGFDLGDSVNHFLVHTRLPPKGWGVDRYTTHIRGSPSQFGDPKTYYKTGMKVLRELAEIYMSRYDAPHLVVAHPYSTKKMSSVFEELGYELERVTRQ